MVYKQLVFGGRKAGRIYSERGRLRRHLRKTFADSGIFMYAISSTTMFFRFNSFNDSRRIEVGINGTFRGTRRTKNYLESMFNIKFDNSEVD